MQVQKTNSVSFKSFSVDKKGKEFLVALYEKTEHGSRPFLTDELSRFKKRMSLYAQKMESKNIDIVLTAEPHENLFWPSMQLKQGNELLKDTINTPSELVLLELDFHRSGADKNWNKASIKKWFDRASAETRKWITLNYVDRIGDPSTSIETLEKELYKPASAKETIDAIFG